MSVRFLHVPRTGGSALKKSWSMMRDEYAGHEPRRERDDWCYGFTRNPWDRLVSLYFDALAIIDAPDFPSWVLGGMNVRPDQQRQMDVRSSPSWRWLKDADWIGRYETRTEDLKELCAILYRPMPGVRTQSRRPDRPLASFYPSADVVDAVAEKYADDIEAFGYTFEAVAV